MGTKFMRTKIAAHLAKRALIIAYKTKDGILTTVSSHKFAGVIGTGFSFHIDGVFTTVVFEKNAKDQFYLELTQPSKDEQIKLYFSNKADFKEFAMTDYNGYEI